MWFIVDVVDVVVREALVLSKLAEVDTLQIDCPCLGLPTLVNTLKFWYARIWLRLDCICTSR